MALHNQNLSMDSSLNLLTVFVGKSDNFLARYFVSYISVKLFCDVF